MRITALSLAFLLASATTWGQDLEWRGQLDEYLSVKGPRMVAVQVAIRCSREFSRQRYGRAYGDTYSNNVMAWARHKADGKEDLAKLVQEILDSTLNHADQILAIYDAYSPSTEQEMREIWDVIEEDVVSSCRIAGIQARAKANQ